MRREEKKKAYLGVSRRKGVDLFFGKGRCSSPERDVRGELGGRVETTPPLRWWRAWTGASTRSGRRCCSSTSTVGSGSCGLTTRIARHSLVPMFLGSPQGPNPNTTVASGLPVRGGLNSASAACFCGCSVPSLSSCGSQQICLSCVARSFTFCAGQNHASFLFGRGSQKRKEGRPAS